jgi:F-type H+-transporting ATPase subunit delta
MAETSIARAYAQAYVELASEAGAVERSLNDLLRIREDLQSDNGLFQALSNPVFTREERVRVLDVVLPRWGADGITANFLRLLLERDRFALVVEVIGSAEELVNEALGRVRVQVATSEPMSPGLEAEIRQTFEKVTGKTVLLETTRDPSLIGGLVARVGSRVYDASLKRRLEDIKNRLLHAQSPGEA